MSAKRKATFYLSEDLLRAVRIRAARNGRRESHLVEEALRAHLGFHEADLLWRDDEPAGGPGRQPARPALAAEAPPADPAPPAPEPAPAALEPAPPATEGSNAPEPAEPEPPAAEPLPPLDEAEATELALVELHALREETGARRR